MPLSPLYVFVGNFGRAEDTWFQIYRNRTQVIFVGQEGLAFADFKNSGRTKPKILIFRREPSQQSLQYYTDDKNSSSCKITQKQISDQSTEKQEH